ncbi:four helix bundle protein [Candidatus Peregrinibacteria bacterium]|nr:four helix bundle protein [Candidatus Peregrinibacteria bacterium]
MKKSIVQEKSYNFAIKIIKFYKIINFQKKEFVLARQLLRSGTSIGANIEEALGGQSKKDFIAKLSIANKEARETNYWIRLLRDTDILNKNDSEKLLSDCRELIKIISSILLTLKRKTLNS